MAIVVALLTWEFLVANRASGVAYNGKSLEYWLSQTPMTLVMTNGTSMQATTISFGGKTYGVTLEKPDDVKRAFGAMGTNCLPFLAKRLAGHETRISTVVDWIKRKCGKKIWFPAKTLERGQAVTAFKYLDPLPDDIYEQIRALSKSGNPEVAASAKEVLRECHKISVVHPTIK